MMDLLSGTTMLIKNRPLEQPSSWAASYRSTGMLLEKKERAMMMLYTEIAPIRMTAQGEPSRPTSLTTR